MYELAPVDKSVDARTLWKEIGIVGEVSVEEPRIEEDIFVDEEYLIIGEKYLYIDSLRESFHDFIGTTERENNCDFFIDPSITIVAVFGESETIGRCKGHMVRMELDVDSSKCRADIATRT